MQNLDNIDKETLEYLKQDYEELKKDNLNGNQQQNNEKKQPNVNPNITTDHAIEIMRTTLTAYYQKNHPTFPMYGYLIDFFCLSCKSLLEKYNLEGSTNVSPEISALLSGGILAFPIIKDVKQGKFKKDSQNTEKKVDNKPKNRNNNTQDGNDSENIQITDQNKMPSIN
jgi:N-acetylmuramoyl-L-alanine amidase